MPDWAPKRTQVQVYGYRGIVLILPKMFDRTLLCNEGVDVLGFDFTYCVTFRELCFLRHVDDMGIHRRWRGDYIFSPD